MAPAAPPAPTVRGRRVRFAAVGCGRVFERYHLPCVDARDDVELVGVVDTDVERARALTAGRPDVWTGDRVQQLIAATRPDALSVCTPNDVHAEPVLTALDAGVAVLCEKPLAATAAEARRMAAHPAAHLLSVNLPFRCHPLAGPLAAAARAGVRSVTASVATPGNRVWRAYTAWYGDRARAGGGALLDLGPHLLDLLVTVFGTPEVQECEVDAPGVEERARVELSFPGDLPATLRIDRAARRLDTSVTLTTADGDHVLDLRRGEFRHADGTVTTGSGRPELAAVTAFFDRLTGTAAAPAGAEEALQLQLLVESAYDRARLAPRP
ncbi:Gfo/Idh/MocA family oxidoreductase [Streptomyces sp. NPDC047315]|uniref:Gfo/Idh/MocA family protein n=1 Tax=Streptomyces sp. NPDC047315 TaxID=3155142 RepID=UPI0033E2F38A